MLYLSLNGQLMQESACSISPNNRSFRYGDGFFETIRLANGEIPLQKLHFERLFASLEALGFDRPGFMQAGYLQQQILQVVNRNNHTKAARIRITVFRGNGGLYDPENNLPNLLVQSWPLQPGSNRLNEKGLLAAIYPDARKTADRFSHIKSNNYLCYVMGARWAQQQQLDEALILNAYGRVADATIASVFIVHNGIVKTPSLAEGGVGGVMRQHLLQAMRSDGIAVEETCIEPAILPEVAEIFLTNAISGIRWVKSLGTASYQHKTAAFLYERFIGSLW